MMLAGSAPAFSRDSAAANINEQIDLIQTLIKQNGGKWVAGKTSLSNLSMEEWQMRVGLNFEPIDAPLLPELSPAALPADFDWRNSSGNYVSAVTDQKKCGSCWAFAMTAGLESYVLITKGTPGVNIDLSEQIMLSCSGAGSCSGGRLNASFLKTTGLPSEIFYPYTATDGDCSSASAGWQSSAYKIDSWGSVSDSWWGSVSSATIKAALVAYGPLPTALMVYEDFMHYKSGIYSYTTGKKLGGHAVLLVGYDDAESYFIVKNSWGTGWGEDGFFRIAYSEMNNVVSFGLSTIAYKAAAPKNALSEAGRLNADETWSRTAPMFAPLLQWKR